MNELEIVNSSMLIQGVSASLETMSTAMQEFKDFMKNAMVDGVDYGVLPNTQKACLFKAGAEKIQMYLGLTPQYKVIGRECVPNMSSLKKAWDDNSHSYKTVETIRNYYSWEFSCELYHGTVKVAEGVGMANTEEEKYVSQYKQSKTSDGMANTVMKIAKKRAFVDAILSVSGFSDMFTQDMESDVIKKLKVDKDDTKKNLTREQVKTVYANLGALGLIKSDLDKIVNEMGYVSLKDIPSTYGNKLLLKIKELAKLRNGE